MVERAQHVQERSLVDLPPVFLRVVVEDERPGCLADAPGVQRVHPLLCVVEERVALLVPARDVQDGGLVERVEDGVVGAVVVSRAVDLGHRLVVLGVCELGWTSVDSSPSRHQLALARTMFFLMRFWPFQTISFVWIWSSLRFTWYMTTDSPPSRSTTELIAPLSALSAHASCPCAFRVGSDAHW